MLKRICPYLVRTSDFLFVRLAAFCVVITAGLALSTSLQNLFVNLVGASAFNYIVGGMLSLVVSIALVHYVDSLLFTIIRGWNVAALARMPKIVRTKSGSLSVGLSTFKEYFLSIGAIYGASLFINNICKQLGDYFWDMVDGIQFLDNLKAFKENFIVKLVVADILHYAYDCCIFYIIKYSESNSAEDVLEQLPSALKKYAGALPDMLLSSLKCWILFDILPNVLMWMTIIRGFFTSLNFFEALLQGIIIWIIFHVFNKIVLDMVVSTAMITAFAYAIHDEGSLSARCIEIMEGIVGGTTDPRDAYDDSELASLDNEEVIDSSSPEPVEDILPAEDDEPSTSIPPIMPSLGSLPDNLASSFTNTPIQDIDEDDLEVDDTEEVLEPFSQQQKPALDAMLGMFQNCSGFDDLLGSEDDDEDTGGLGGFGMSSGSSRYKHNL